MAALNGFVALARRSRVCTKGIGRVQSILFKQPFLKTLRTTAADLGEAPTQVFMPALSPTMEEGTIVTWLKKEGDAVNPGDALCEIETDKATITMDTEEEGVLAKIIVPSGTNKVKVNDLIALIVEEGQDISKVEIPLDGNDFHTDKGHEVKSHTASHGSHLLLSPAARYHIETNKLDATQIPASGRGGRILKEDILRFLSDSEIKQVAGTPVKITTGPSTPQPSPKPAASTTTQTKPAVKSASQPVAKTTKSSYTDLPNSAIRSALAKKLTTSKTAIPHVYASVKCVVDNLHKIKQSLKERDIAVSMNDLIVKIAGVTLHQVPKMNAVWDGQGVKVLDEIDIAVDVATDVGLITPIVRDAAHLDVSQISLVLKDLASRARTHDLHHNEDQGGSFSISNLGMYNVTEFTAVIKPPQASVLAIGSTRLTLSADNILQNVMTVTLSCDGRVVDNEQAARFLEVFKKNIENPAGAGL